MVDWAVNTFPLSPTLPSTRLHSKDVMAMTFLGPSAGTPALSHVPGDIFMNTPSREEKILCYLVKDILECQQVKTSFFLDSVIVLFTDSVKTRAGKLLVKGHTALSNEIIVSLSQFRIYTMTWLIGERRYSFFQFPAFFLKKINFC